MDRAGRVWAAALVALFPPSFRASVGEDLRRLLLDQARAARTRGRGRLTWFLVANTARCMLDAAGEWLRVAGETRREGRGGEMGGLMRAFRMAVRGLVRRPSYSVPAVLTVALGVGAVTTMFGVVYGVVLKPLPYPEPERLVEVSPAERTGGDAFGAFSLPDFRDWQDGTRRLAAMGAFTTLPSDLVFTGGEEAVEVETAFVTSGFFEAMETAPLVGRLPRRDEEEGDNRILVLSHGLWTQRFGGDPDAVGSLVDIDGVGWRVVGVMPPDFAYPAPDVEVWTFLSVIPASSIPFQYRGVRLLEAVGRLAPGTTVEAAEEELAALASGLAEAYPDSNEEVVGATVRPLREGIVGDVDTALWILLAAGVVTLLAVCANVMNLAMAREARRAPDLAVRMALGASRGRLAGIVVTESVLVSLVGGALGLLAASWAVGLLSSAGGGLLPRAAEVAIHWPVFLFALGVSVTVGVAFALVPGLRAGRAGVAGTLRRSGRSVTGRGRGALVAGQVTMAVVLVVGAGLLARGTQALARTDPGFDPEGLVVADMTIPSSRYPERSDYLPRIDGTIAALEAIPGVESVGAIRRFPFLGQGEQVPWQRADRPTEDGVVNDARILQVEGDAFGALGATIVEGRAFDASDRAEGRFALVINTALARAAFSEGGPVVGRALVLADEPFEIVGVVADIRQGGLEAPVDPTMYILNRLSPRRGAAFLVRGGTDPAALMRDVRAAIRAADPAQAITVLAPAEDLVGDELARPRLFASMLAALAGLALVLAAVGVYGVVAFSVAERRREVGIRMAVGATAGGVTRLVVVQGMTPVVVGAAVGVVVAALVADAAGGMLYGVPPHDPLSYATALVVLVGVGLAACWLPGRRASRTPPTVALAAE